MFKQKLYNVIKKIITFSLRFIFIKKNYKKISFMSFPDLSDNSWYLFNYINDNRENLILVWLIDQNLSKTKLNRLKNKNKNNKLLFIRKKSFRGIYHFLSSRVVFFTHIPYFFSQKNLGPTQINLWHGMPIKKIGVYRHKKLLYYYGDFAISTSDKYSEILSNAFGIQKKYILPFGLPRNDILVNKKNIFFNKKNLKLVLWLPTFRNTKSFTEIKDSTKENFLMEWPLNFLDNLNQVAKKYKTLIIIKTHPLDNLRILKKYSNITHLKNDDLTKLNLDLQDLISVSDGLITDISSVIIDYILTKKHLGITINSIKTFKRGLISELKLFNNLKFHSIKNINDFKIFFKKINTNQKVNIDPKNIFYSKKAINSSKQITKFFNI